MAWHGSTRRATLPPDWPTIRPRILRRDHHRCQLAGPRCLVRATEVDHIGDRDDHRDENLRAACRPCHMTRSSSQGGQAAAAAYAAIAARRYRPSEPHPGMR